MQNNVISELKAALAKTTDENLELIEKCEKLKTENEVLRRENDKIDDFSWKSLYIMADSEITYLYSKLRRQKKLIGSLKRQRRYLVKSRRYWVVEKQRENARNYFLSKEKRIDNENLNQTILDLNAQIGELRVTLANTVTKMKDKQIEPGGELFNAIKDAAVQSMILSLCKARILTYFEAVQCGLKANLPERPVNENIISNHKYNITVNGRRI